MRSHSELSVERDTDGLGNSTARRQHHRQRGEAARAPLRQDEDMTVSVVGTVFLVNAETDGSRVGVIEGEVHVREGTRETSLRPGQQVSTSPQLVARPLKDEIAWSRNADALHKILDTFMKGMAATAGPLEPLRDASGPAARVRPGSRRCRPGVRRGIDPAVRSGQRPRGPRGCTRRRCEQPADDTRRLHALCLTLATNRAARLRLWPGQSRFPQPGRPWSRVAADERLWSRRRGWQTRQGGPDWVRSEHYTIDAVAADAADAASMMGPMIRRCSKSVSS
jgi:hypothetical protein